MMNAIENIIFKLLVGTLLMSCNSKSEEKDIESLFKDNENLTGYKFSIHSDGLGNPADIVVLDSFLVLNDPHNGFTHRLINLKKKAIVGKFGVIGKGPGEFMTPVITEVVSETGKIIGVYDRRSFTYTEIPLDSVLNNKKYFPKAVYGPFNSNYSRLVKTNNNFFIGTGIFQGRYALSDKSGELAGLKYDYPFAADLTNASWQDLSFAYQGKIKSKPDGSKIVLATSSSPNIEISEVADGTVKKLNDIHLAPPKFTSASTGNTISVDYRADNIRAFNDITVSDQYIYLLYSGRSVETHPDSPYSANIILVLNWNGEPLKQYNLDRDVRNIAIDEKNKRLYANTVTESGEPEIVYYNLEI